MNPLAGRRTGRVKEALSHDIDRYAARMSNLQRREIQVPMAVCLLRGIADAVGLDKTVALAAAAVRREATETGRMMARRFGGNTLKELLRVFAEVWAADAALEYRVLEQSPVKLSIDVRRCRYAELYEKLGVREFGYCLSCCRDGPYASGFNPRIRLVRTQTIMQGAPFCDFRFIMKRRPASQSRNSGKQSQ